MMLAELWAISQALKSTTPGSTGRRSGSATGAQRSMLYNQIGKLTQRYVAPRSTDVTVEQYSQGIFLIKPKIVYKVIKPDMTENRGLFVESSRCYVLRSYLYMITTSHILSYTSVKYFKVCSS
jgi:hypothetical protein